MEEDPKKLDDFPALLLTAKQQLILHEHRAAISTCSYGLELLQKTEDLRHDEDSDEHKLKTAFGMLSVQAIAASEEISSVESFVEEWFGEVKAFPAEILQIW